MKEIIILGESYFDRIFLKTIYEKYNGSDFDFNLVDKHTNKESLLKDFEKYRKRAYYSQKAEIDVSIIFSLDLDFDANCITNFFAKKNIKPNEFTSNFIFTVQVREIESWVLSDPLGLEKWTKIHHSNFERALPNFESEEKPTKTFLNIIKNNSPHFQRRLCANTNYQKKSEYYNEELLTFIAKYFDPERARNNNKSLDRFIKKISKLN